MIKIAYLVSEPIIYQEAMLQYLASLEDVELKVFYRSARATREHRQEGFNVEAQWDIDFLQGYDYEFLPSAVSDMKFGMIRPLNYGFQKAIKRFGPDVLWVHGYSDLFRLYALRWAYQHGIKTLVRGESTLSSCQQTRFKSRFRRTFFKMLDRLVDGYLTIGSLNRQFYEHYNIHNQKLYHAPYTVNNEHFARFNEKFMTQQTRHELGVDADTPVIIFAGKMFERKRCHDLVEAFNRLMAHKPAVKPHLLLIGDGPDRAQLEKEVTSKGLDNVTFLGFVNQGDLPRYYAAADIFVLPSEREPWAVVVNEAMNAECAIIATDEVGSANDLVDDSNGAVYPVGDINALRRALEHLTQDQNVCRQAQKTSRERIKQWDISHTAEGVRQAAYAVI